MFKTIGLNYCIEINSFPPPHITSIPLINSCVDEEFKIYEDFLLAKIENKKKSCTVSNIKRKKKNTSEI